MSCYFLAQITIHDSKEYDRYLESYDQVFEQFAGKVVAVDERPVLLEGEWPCSRTVLIRFPNKEEARRWYDSAGYREIVRHRQRGSTANIVLVEGKD